MDFFLAGDSRPVPKAGSWPYMATHFKSTRIILRKMLSLNFETKLRLDGFEPSTLSLKGRCSTTELKSHKVTPRGFEPLLLE